MYEQELRAAEQMATGGMHRVAAEGASVPVEIARAAGAVAQHAFLGRGQLRLVPFPDDNEDGIFPEVELAQVQEKPAGLEVGVGLHPGFHRKDAPNEDALFEIHGTRTAGEGLQQVGLFVVADGMGSAGVGHEASRLAISALCAVMVPAMADGSESVCAGLLKEGVLSANLAVYQRNRELPERKTGASITAALMLGSIVSIASVGNSRAYLYRQRQELLQVTQDHTTAAIQGLAVSAQSKHTAARQGILERYLGRQALVEVDLFTVNMQAGDILMLCSRGLWGMVCDAELVDILATPGQHPAQLSGTLVQRALNYGGVENISVIVVRCPAGQDEQ